MTAPPSDVCGWSCGPSVSVAKSRGLNGPVLVATVQHAPDCPWLAAVAPTGEAIVTSPAGVLTHCVASV